MQSMEKVYAITSPLLSAFKLGAWSGQYKKLKVRYVTYYGNSCSIVVYECQSCRSTESHLKKVLAPFHIINELYRLEDLTEFHTFCNTNCGSFVAMDNKNVHATQRAKRLKRQLETTNDMQNDVEERLLEMQEALPELIASIACGEQVDTAVLQAVGVDKLEFIDMYNKRVVSVNKQLMAVGETHMMPPLNNADIINDRLLHSPDISDEQFCDISKRVATAEECWAMYKHQYKVGWSIQLVSNQFIKDNGNQLMGSSMKILFQMLFPKILVSESNMQIRNQLLLRPLPQSPYGNPYDYHEDPLSLQAAYLVKAELISEVLSCLGFKHPFDVEHRVLQEELLVLEGKTNMSRLMSTKFFADYNNNIKFFSDRAVIAKDWTKLRNVTDTLKLLLKAAAITFTPTGSRQIQTNGKRVRQTVFGIDEEETERIAELVRLRMGHRSRPALESCSSSEALEYLRSLNMKHYGDLITTD